MTPVQILSLVSLILTGLISLCMAYQLVYLFVPLFGKHKRLTTQEQKRYAILIAARNEEKVLPHLLHSIGLQDYPAHLLHTYVAADNCTDSTAAIAEAAGATVFVRNDTKRIGKGYVIHDLLEFIAQRGELEQYDGFLIFDADNLLDASYVTNMNRTCCAGYEAYCGYRNSKNFGSNWISAGHALWYLHDCEQLNLSRHLLGLPCSVTGTGFGFTRQLLEKMGGWNFFALTEDIEFSVWCATHGVKIGYCHNAIVYDEQPVNLRNSFRQRVRWVQGTIQVSCRHFGALIRGLGQGGRLTYACVEHMTLTIWGYLICALMGIVGTVLSILNLGLIPTLIITAVMAMGGLLHMFLTAALLLIFQGKRIHATGWQKIKGLFAFPLYVISFLPIFFMAIFSKFNWPPIEHSVSISNEELNV